MTEDDQYPVHSPLSQTLTHNGKTVSVEIYDDGNDGWLLEVVDQYGNSTVWDQPFKTDADALDEVHLTIADEGIESLIGLPSGAQMTSPEPVMYGLSDQEIDELGGFLMSDATSDETMMMDCLDGFLTALVSGPVMLSPSVWLPKIWGPSANDEPIFETYAQAERITGLIMRHFNGIADTLENAPDAFEPVFDITVYPDGPREYEDGEMWAYGYMMGIELQGKDWERFFEEPESEGVLRPIYLLGAEEVTPEEEALTDTPVQREELSKQIPASVAWIYQFWQPYRQAVVERMIATTFQREYPKIGRNDPCPCGSGKKFKKCCGASTILH